MDTQVRGSCRSGALVWMRSNIRSAARQYHRSIRGFIQIDRSPRRPSDGTSQRYRVGRVTDRGDLDCIASTDSDPVGVNDARAVLEEAGVVHDKRCSRAFVGAGDGGQMRSGASCRGTGLEVQVRGGIDEEEINVKNIVGAIAGSSCLS